MLAMIDLPPGLEGHTVTLLPPDPRDGVSEAAAVLGTGTPYDLVKLLLDSCDPKELDRLKLHDALRAQQRIARRRLQEARDAAEARDRDEPDPVPAVVAEAFEAAHAACDEDDGEID